MQKYIKYVIYAVIVLFVLQIISFGGGFGIKKAKAGGPWYIDNTPGVGNDGNNCTSPATPCATLGATRNKATAGDTVYIYPGIGTYSSPATGFSKGLHWEGVGNLGDITITNTDNTLGNYVNASNNYFTNLQFTNTGTNPVNVVYITTTLDNINFINSRIVGPGTDTNDAGIYFNPTSVNTTITFNNTQFTGSYYFVFNDKEAGGISGSLNVTDCTFNLDSAALLLNSVNSGGSFSFNGGSIDLLAGGSTDGLIKIQGNASLSVQNMDPISIHTNSPLTNFSTDSTTGSINVSGNTIDYPGTPGVDYVNRVISVIPSSSSSSHNITINGNTITTGLDKSDTMNGIIYIRDQNAPAQIIISNNSITTTTEGDRNQIRIYNAFEPVSPSKVIISGNTLKTRSLAEIMVQVGTDGYFADDDQTFDGAVIENNRAYGPGYFGLTPTGIHGFLMGHSIKLHFRNNYVNGFGLGAIFKSQGKSFTNLGGAYGNIFVNNNDAGVLVKGTDYVPVYNNIFYLGQGVDVSQGLVSVANDETTHPSAHAWVRNNIFYRYNNIDLYQKFIFVQKTVNADSTTGFTSDYNIFYPSGGTSQFTFGDAADIDFSSWKNTYGLDANGTETNPGFNDVTNLLNEATINNFALLETSPAINAGEQLPANTDYDGAVVYEDFFGNSIPQFEPTHSTIGSVDYIDTTPPVSSDIITGTAGDNGWYKGTLPTITLSAVDNVTNVQLNTIYADRTTDPPASEYSTPLTALEGDNTLYFYAKDYKNNSEVSHHPTEIKADSVAPTGSISIDGGNPYTTSLDVTLTLSAADATSGMAGGQMQFSNNDSDWSGWEAYGVSKAWNLGAGTEGTRTVFVQYKDTAGNVSATDYSDTIVYDHTPPTVSAGADKTTKAQFTQVGSAIDLVSGVASVTWSKISGPGAITFSDSGNTTTDISADTDGTYVLQLSATDNAGNSATDNMTLVWDTLPPTLNITSPTNGSSTTNTFTNVIGTATDATSGISSVTINGVPISSPSIFSVAVSLTLGSNTITVTATDNAGNSTSQTLSVTRTATPANNPVTEVPSNANIIQTVVNFSTSFLILDPQDNTDTLMSPDSIATFTTQYPVLHGHTFPDAVVTIEIHSDPQTFQTTADTSGNWEYKLTSPLSFGEHTIKITINAKDTNELISDNNYKINIVEKAKANSQTQPATNQKSSLWWLWLVGGIILLTGIIVVLKARKK